MRPRFTLFIDYRQANLRIGLKLIFKYIWIFPNLPTNIKVYLVIQKSTNKYSIIFVLGKWHKYKYEYTPKYLYDLHKNLSFFGKIPT